MLQVSFSVLLIKVMDTMEEDQNESLKDQQQLSPNSSVNKKKWFQSIALFFCFAGLVRISSLSISLHNANIFHCFRA